MRCLSLDDRLITVHVFLFLPALYSGCFLKLWRFHLAHAPLMKADPLRVTDLTMGGERDDDCRNIFQSSGLSRTLLAGEGVTCIALKAHWQTGAFFLLETTEGRGWRGSLVATGSEKHLTQDWLCIEKSWTPPQRLLSRESASQSFWYKHQSHRFGVWKGFVD